MTNYYNLNTTAYALHLPAINVMGQTLERVYYSSPVWMQDILISSYGYNLYRKRYLGLYHESLAKIKEALQWSKQQVYQYQCEKLFSMVKHCRQNIPYYQSVFSEYGVHENDITSPEDIDKLPTLSKQILREKAHLFRETGSKPYMIQHTSGSTGTPLSLWVNEYTYKLAMALLVDHETNHGVQFGARRATFAGRMLKRADDLNPPFSRYNRAENQRLFSSYHLKPATFAYYKNELDRFQPVEIIGYPSAICDLATQYQQADCKPGFRPKAIITNSESLLVWQRELIETVFDCRVFDYYGTAEYVLFAGQGKDDLYHLNPIIGITELVPDELGNNSGQILASTLTNTLMPLLRYEIGDTAEAEIVIGDNARPVARLKTIIGRIDDYIETPDGRRIGRIDHIFKGLSGIREAQVIQDKKNHCFISIVLQEGINKLDQQHLLENFKNRTGGELKATIIEVNGIPKGPNGKFKSVVRQF